MRLDASNYANLGPKEFRILTSIEIGMKNHEYVPLPLIISIANLPSCGIKRIITNLHKFKLIVHWNKQYDGYKLTYLGLDYLALRALNLSGIIESIGRRIGVGKEADVHIAKQPKGKLVVIKFHRLGRKSFRTIKLNRDYLGKRSHASWMYLAQIAAKKEYSYLLSMHEKNLPVPNPIETNRHAVVMQYIDGIPLSQVRMLKNPRNSLEFLFKLIIDMAGLGVIHGDFNEFNIILEESNDKLYVIDFPQVIPIYHQNAEMYFNRDVNCIVDLFNRKFKVIACDYPKFNDIVSDELINSVKSAQNHPKISFSDDLALSLAFQQLKVGENDICRENDISSESNSRESNSRESNSRESNSRESNEETENSNCREESDESSSCAGDTASEDADKVEDSGQFQQIKQIEDESGTSRASSEDPMDSSEFDSSNAYKVKNNIPIQIWHPHIKKDKEKTAHDSIRNKFRNKSKSEQRKNCKQNKTKNNVKIF